MNADPNTNRHAAAFDRLVQEFMSAASNDAPILHQRIYGLPDQPLTVRMWEDFRLAHYPRFERLKAGEWQEWFPHTSGLVCSRFVGTGDKAVLDHFRRLADTGMALIATATQNPESAWHKDDSFLDRIKLDSNDNNTFLCWLDAVHLTASQCRTLFLNVTVGNWAYTRTGHETVEQVAAEMSEPTPFGLSAFPIHPIVSSLQHDVFRSSAEAIKVWIGSKDIERVGSWPDRPPLYLSPITQERQREGDQVSSSVLGPSQQHEHGTSSSGRSSLVVDRDTFSVSYHGKVLELRNTKAFYLLERLNRRPGTVVSISNLIADVWDDENTETATVQKTVSNLRRRLEKVFGAAVWIEPQKDHYRLMLS